jgi:hypothetical protein
MKKLFTLLFISVSMTCFGQSAKKETKPDTASFALSKFENTKALTYQNSVEQMTKIQQKHYEFLGEFIQANGIDVQRVSIHPDSLKYLPADSKHPNGSFLFVFRPIKPLKK